MAAKASDKYIPWYFVAFFSFLTAVFTWFGYIAHHTYTGVVMDDAYEKGLKYNDVIEKAAEQEKLGWTADISAVSAGGRALITVRLKDGKGAGIVGAKVKLWLVRPVQAGLDQHVTMQDSGGGIYVATADLPARGLWELRAEARKDGHRFQAFKRTEI